jgi:hypothetical protein
MKKVLLVLLILGFAGVASAGMITFNLKGPAGEKSMMLTPGSSGTITMYLYADVKGSDADLTNDGLIAAYMNVITTNSGLTGLTGIKTGTAGTGASWTRNGNFTNPLGTGVKAGVDLNADGIRDYGSLSTDPAVAPTLVANPMSAVAPAWPVYSSGYDPDGVLPAAVAVTDIPGGKEFLLGYFRYDYAAVGGTGQAVVSPSIPVWTGTSAAKVISFFDVPDAQKYDDPISTAYKSLFYGTAPSQGVVEVSPLTLVIPEPSTMILLGMGALALLAIRRRK